MITKVEMTIEEYDEIKYAQNQPSQMLMDTNANLLTKLEAANKTIKELEASLSMNVSVGVKPRFGDYEDEVLVVEEKRAKITGFTSKGWNTLEILDLQDSIGESLESVVRYYKGVRTASALRAKLNKLGIRVKRGILTRED